MKRKSIDSINEIKSSNIYREVISTDIYPLDEILKGGLEKGTFLTIVAEAAMGKTSICLNICKNFCEKGYRVLYIDSEGKVSLNLLQNIGLEKHINNNFYYFIESTFTAVEGILDLFLDENAIDLIIIDSIPALVHEGYTKTKKDDPNAISIVSNNTNYNSGQLTKFISKYVSIFKKTGVSLVVVNQFRNKFDAQGTVLKDYGTKNLRYASDCIIKIKKPDPRRINKYIKLLVEKEHAVNLEFEVVKSNKSYPGRLIPFQLVYGYGISNDYAVLNALFSTGKIYENNNYYTLSNDDNEITLHGIKEVMKYVTEHDEYKSIVSEYYRSID